MSAVPVRAPSRVGVPLRNAPTRSPLRVVPAPALERGRAPFVLLCMVVLLGALLGTLLLNTAMAQGEYRRHALQTELALSAQAQQRMLTELELLAAPEHLTRAAAELGMVQASRVGYLRLADGVVLVDPGPARAD